MAKTTTNKQLRPKRRREKIGLDALTICFLTTNSIFEKLRDGEQLQWWGEDGGADFFTFRIDKESDDRTIVINVNIPDGDNANLLGVLTLHSAENRKYANRAFLSVYNKALYDGGTHYIHFVASAMGLEFNNITKMDLALTSTFNYITAILKSVRNYDDLDMIYNAKCVEDINETLGGFTEQYGETRKKKLPNPTLYFGQKKNTGIHVKVYDKSRELTEQSPNKEEYLNKWLGFEGDTLFRVEVSLTNPEVRDLCAQCAKDLLQEWGHDGNIINLVNLPVFLEYAFKKTLGTVLYFRQGRQRIDIWEL